MFILNEEKKKKRKAQHKILSNNVTNETKPLVEDTTFRWRVQMVTAGGDGGCLVLRLD